MKKHLTLILLTLIATVQFFDRALMVVIMEPLKQEFQLSDSQLGLLSGFSYAAAFAIAGIPLGWLADRRNRRNLLAGLVALWSILVGMAGMAGSFAALVATRVGIGAMDAGGQPCSVSMIADLYPREKRATAVAIFYVGVPVGMLLGFMLGAMVAVEYGWRKAFYVAALPGMVLALLLWLVAREPQRGGDSAGQDEGPAPGFGATIAFMRGQSALLNVIGASILVTATSSAMMSWIGSLLVRSHGLSLAHVGMLTALCMGGFGALGTVLFGIFADRAGARDMRFQPRLMALAAAMVSLMGSAVALLPTVTGVAIALAVFAAFVAGLNGPTYALSQSLVKVRMRATSISILVVLLNLIGVGLGPTIAGVLSDVFAARFGADSVRWAMVCVLSANLPAVWLFLRAARTINADLQRTDA
jgi:predicted MFS family arabinose efflux permease